MNQEKRKKISRKFGRRILYRFLSMYNHIHPSLLLYCFTTVLDRSSGVSGLRRRSGDNRVILPSKGDYIVVDAYFVPPCDIIQDKMEWAGGKLYRDSFLPDGKRT